MIQVVSKLKLLKQSQKEPNRKHFRNVDSEATKDRKELLVVQLALQNNPLDQRLQEQENERYLKFRRSSYLAEVFLQQRRNAYLIKLGDDNTKCFYAAIYKHRKL